MAENCPIEWCHHTFNIWRGCSKVHAGCTNCYAEVNVGVKLHGVQWGQNGTRVAAAESYWQQPLRWNREAARLQTRHRVFCASLCDVFEDWSGPMLDHKGRRLYWSHSRQPHQSRWHWIAEDDCAGEEEPVTMNDCRARLFRLIHDTPWLDWLLLSKRPENAREMMAGAYAPDEFWSNNVWLGTSVSDQETADKWISELLKLRDLARVLFVSAEPLLGPIELVNGLQANRYSVPTDYDPHSGYGIEWTDPGPNFLPVDWVIVGGESGPSARPCDIAWIRDIVAQTRASGTACFVKQLGANRVSGTQRLRGGLPDGGWYSPKKGNDPRDWPEEIRVREFPTGARVS